MIIRYSIAGVDTNYGEWQEGDWVMFFTPFDIIDDNISREYNIRKADTFMIKGVRPYTNVETGEQCTAILI